MSRRTILFFFIGYFFQIVQALHLTTPQIASIRNLIQHPKMTPRHRNTLNTVLYNAYEKWAVSRAVQFQSLHKNKCRNIDIAELVFASKIGLFKSIQKYNGKYDLRNYSYMYIQSELLSVVSDTYSSSILPKSIRRKKKTDFVRTPEQRSNKVKSEGVRGITGEDSSSKVIDKVESQVYNHLLQVQPFSMYEPWKIELMTAIRDTYIDNIAEKYETTENIHDYLDKQPLFIKRLFLLYMNFWSKTNREPSRKYLAEMMCCSKETNRQKLQ
jgi:hypothetical protein